MKTQLLAGTVAFAFALGGLAQAAPMGSMNNGNSHANDPTAANAKVNTQAPNQSPFDYSKINQNQQSANKSLKQYSLINLTNQQQKTLYNAASDWKAQNVKSQAPGHPIIAGAKLPSGVHLKAMPSQAKQAFASNTKFQNFKLAKLQGGNVVLVNPKDRMVEAVITQKEAQQGKSGYGTVGQGNLQTGSMVPSKKPGHSGNQ